MYVYYQNVQNLFKNCFLVTVAIVDTSFTANNGTNIDISLFTISGIQGFSDNYLQIFLKLQQWGSSQEGICTYKAVMLPCRT